MTRSQRMLAVVVASAMLIAGFAFGRMAETPKTTAEESKSGLASSTTNSSTPESISSATNTAASESQAFYLSDFKTGYTDGYNAGMDGQSSSVINTTRAGYNDGFKDGYADGFQTRASQQVTSASARPVGSSARFAQQEVVYRPSGAPVRRKGSSKLKTALTIAAPAALGAGIGLAAGGKKGAGVGALVGGGGGALYHLIKNRD